jgi:hypothetical protein
MQFAMERYRARQQDKARRQAASQALINLGAQIATQPQPRAPNYGGNATGTAFYQREYTQGLNKVCVYDRMGSVYTITVGATDLCPLTQ